MPKLCLRLPKDEAIPLLLKPAGGDLGMRQEQRVERFHRKGLAAFGPRHGSGAKVQYTAQQQPELEIDGVL
jgi:hypothetical protein